MLGINQLHGFFRNWSAGLQRKLRKCIDVRVGILLILKQQTTDKRYPTVCCQCQAIENVATVQNTLSTQKIQRTLYDLKF